MSDIQPCSHNYPRQHHHHLTAGDVVQCLTGIDRPSVTATCTACQIGAPLFQAQAVVADKWWSGLPSGTRVGFWSQHQADTPDPLPLEPAPADTTTAPADTTTTTDTSSTSSSSTTGTPA